MSKPARNSTKRPAPLSIRLSEAERCRLVALAGNRAISSYVKEVVLGVRAGSRAQRRPDTDSQRLSQLLAHLGRSDLAGNLERVVRQAEAGTIYCDENLVVRLQNACADVRAMRTALMEALGKDASVRSPSAHSITGSFENAAGLSVRP